MTSCVMVENEKYLILQTDVEDLFRLIFNDIGFLHQNSSIAGFYNNIFLSENNGGTPPGNC